MKNVTKGMIMATAAAALLAAGCASQSCPGGNCSKPAGHHSSCKGISSCKSKKACKSASIKPAMMQDDFADQA